MTGDPVLRLTLPAEPDAVRDALLRLARDLPAMGVRAESLGTVELVLAELLNNIVEHAYSAGPRGEIELELERRRSRLICTIVDRGRPMPGGALPPRRDLPVFADRRDLPEGGFGWFLIHELVEDLSYSRRNGMNVVRVGLSLG
ncbi:ATP-binding protein [Mangrovicoccus algicola]|uniref:ATP-binding protein n=1 Tax=Mangrovicoccus algicola TaxID=2771008 RepID=A0A8J7CXB1_9RHOB|nr:ATP-binding protein [Mangrovicoccus algicola]MBE3640349.1 ATP-binding protein [Mangrovicoccus algicola]